MITGPRPLSDDSIGTGAQLDAIRAQWRPAALPAVRQRAAVLPLEPCAQGLRRLRLALPDQPGDPWGFLLVIDRGALILPPIALIYFGLLPRDPVAIVALFAAFIGLIIYTAPHRYGVCIALDVLTRRDDDPEVIG